MTLDTIGLDLHKRETQVCILTADGELMERRIATTRARFTDVLGSRPPARILEVVVRARTVAGADSMRCEPELITRTGEDDELHQHR